MNRATKVSIAVGNRLAAWLEWLEEKCADGSRALKRCPNCGENYWYGQPCPELRVSSENLASALFRD